MLHVMSPVRDDFDLAGPMAILFVAWPDANEVVRPWIVKATGLRLVEIQEDVTSDRAWSAKPVTTNRVT